MFNTYFIKSYDSLIATLCSVDYENIKTLLDSTWNFIGENNEKQMSGKTQIEER